MRLPDNFDIAAHQARVRAGRRGGVQSTQTTPQTTGHTKSNRSDFALGRLPTGTLNNTEARYAQHLEMRKRGGDIIDFHFEAINLRLADRCFYRPDFLVVLPSAIEFHEVKGRWQDDALVKIKVAARLYPYFRFAAYRWCSKSKLWQEREF